jgi:hypothetical protein
VDGTINKQKITNPSPCSKVFSKSQKTQNPLRTCPPQNNDGKGKKQHLATELGS